jgi:mannan polymerase II complex MNN11 subunit
MLWYVSLVDGEALLTEFQEHVVQWHPTVLTKLALVPVRTINSYTVDIASRGGKAVTYQDGDFVVRAVGCERDQNRKCEGEMKPWFLKWKSQFGQA